jgi:hypothetical protein
MIRTRRARLLATVVAACLAATTALGAQATEAASSHDASPPNDAKPAEGFRAEGSVYVSTASGKGSSAQEAEDKARGAALRGLFAGLGKDRLFAEVFTASPPLGLAFQLVDSSRSNGSYAALVALKVDDESIRIVERGPYLAAALSILDKAEGFSDEAETHKTEAGAAESAADLGAALGLYGMSAEACRSALELVDPLADPSIFSDKGKRTAPELKKGLAAILAEASAGIERVEKAQAALTADASSAAAGDVADAAIAVADATETLLNDSAPVLGDLGAYDEDRLSPLRDRIATQRRAVSDSLAALDRAQASLHTDGLAHAEAGFAIDKLDFAKRRLATADASLAAAYRRVDREIRDPAARRAARAKAIRWTFLHEPREYLSLRAYLPFMLTTGEDGLESAPLDARASFEGAFPFGRGGVWVRSVADYASADLEPGSSDGDEVALTQSFDFGVWGKSLVFAGYRWDWLRRVDGESFPKKGAIGLGVGGVYEHGSSEDRFHRADWTLALSYELPYDMGDTRLQNLLNAGLDARFRLGSVALLEASLSKRLDEEPGSQYASILRWAVDLGIRLPPPFAFGAEYCGSYVQPLLDDGSLGDASAFKGGRFRFFLQYSI